MPKRSALDSVPGGPAQKARWALESRAAASDSAPKASSLARLLLEKWGTGLMSAPLVQELAMAAVNDGSLHDDLVALSKLGSSGLYPGKCHGELLSKLVTNPLAASLCRCTMYYKFHKKITSSSQHMLLPHELFATLHSDYPDVFRQQILGGDPGNVERFWHCMKNHPGLRGNPICKRPDWNRKYVPLGLHGDGVTISGVGRSWSNSIDAYSWNSLLGRGATSITNFLIFVLFPKYICSSGGVDSLALFFKKLTWSLYWLSVGKWPTRDHNGAIIEGGKAGQPLADGWCGTLFAFRADLDHLHKAYGLESSNSLSPCILCRANTTDIPWTDVRRSARWLDEMWNDRGAWLAAHPDANILFRELPGVSVCNFIPDFMHTCHLGIYQYVFGSILKYLSHHRLASDPETNAADMFTDIKAAYKAYGIKYVYTDLRVSMYWSGGSEFPRLKGKAANIKGLATPLLLLVQKHLDDVLEECVLMKKLMESIVKLEELMDRHKDVYVFPEASQREFVSLCFGIGQLNTKLGHIFHPRHLPLFSHAIKSHYLCHLGLLAAVINPRLCWCYSGEDLMHQVKILVQSCYSGTPPVLIASKVVQKYIQALHLRLDPAAFRC